MKGFRKLTIARLNLREIFRANFSNSANYYFVLSAVKKKGAFKKVQKIRQMISDNKASKARGCPDRECLSFSWRRSVFPPPPATPSPPPFEPGRYIGADIRIRQLALTRRGERVISDAR
ncbi:hypothetical protein PUN28_005537 [Cardiocondyla obscurior]|uniref:Ribosomal protein S14 n=1 Tax=Cardiocondyla obscurior TaxID=286306 RepID=A0AAW2GIA8_9HYME